MSVIMKTSKITTAILGAAVLAAGSWTVSATELKDIQNADALIQKDAINSQKKVERLYDQAMDMLGEYRMVTDEFDALKFYNDFLATQVADQDADIASLQSQISGLEDTRQGVVPLTFKMIDALDQFVNLDIPFLIDERKARVARLKEMMSESGIPTQEKFRLVLDAYQIENEYARKLSTYEGTLDLDGKELTVDFFYLGRVALVAQSLDQKQSWKWDHDNKTWVVLSDDYNRPISQAIKIARKQAAPDLMRLPIDAAKETK